jgi:Domain of unknown function (DUF4260)
MLKNPSVLLRLEGLMILIASVALYMRLDGNLWRFFLLLLVPDVSMLGYAVNVRVGAVVYNAGHTMTLPLALAIGGLMGGMPQVIPYALIWTAHIGMDRVLGYGLKYPTYFRDTHLQRL